MRRFIFPMMLLMCGATAAQSPAESIYNTERAFEKMVAEKGVNAGFIEFMTADGIMFSPDVVNGRELWRSRPASPAGLTWNPIVIGTSSNGILGYSIGNSIYRPKSKDEPNGIAGHYISIWTRQPNGDYRAVLDTGISHEKPASVPTAWRSSTENGDANVRRLSAADSSTGFYMLAASNVKKAYEKYLAGDVIIMREGTQPAVGRSAALSFISKQTRVLNFDKRKSFIEAADLAYVHSGYSITDKAGKTIERGNFVQVWRLRKERWQIVADILVPIPAESK